MNRMVLRWHLVESLVTYVFTLHMKAPDCTKLNFQVSMVWLLDELQGFSQFHGLDLGQSEVALHPFSLYSL